MFSLISLRSKVLVLAFSAALGGTLFSSLTQVFQQTPPARWAAQRVVLPPVTVVGKRLSTPLEAGPVTAAKLARQGNSLQTKAL